MTRKLWVLLALGSLTHQIEHHRLALDELRADGKAIGAVPGSPRSTEAAMQTTERRRAAMRELLPHDTPEDWIALGAAAIFDEYERKVGEIGRRLNPSVRDSDVQPLRRQVEAVCVAGSPPFNPSDSPSFTRDRKDDPIVYTALLNHADYLISDDRDIVPNGAE